MRPTPLQTRFDAIVVGAGPAGSATAIQLARAGWSVALIERQPFPRRKVCGECIAASNLPLLNRLGIGAAFDALAGPELRQVSLLRGDEAVTAKLPRAPHPAHPWGRALGRETLDGLLLDRARAAGAALFQPCTVQAILGAAGDWQCRIRVLESAASRSLSATVMVDAHGCWEALPIERPLPRQPRRGSDLLAFKANFAASQVRAGQISVLALDGGYGGMVVADSGLATIACCIRRDRLRALRHDAPGRTASEVVEAWLQRECSGVQQALRGAMRTEPWLAAGPLDPGVHLDGGDGIFRVGNAAGEAHPILGEGMSMALQSAALLCAHLVGPDGSMAVPDAAAQPGRQRAYTAAWRHEFTPRLRVAAVFAHLAMRPLGASLLMKLVSRWPALLTHGARWGGKVHLADLASITR